MRVSEGRGVDKEQGGVERWLETQDWRGQGGGVLGHKEQGTCGGEGQVV